MRKPLPTGRVRKPKIISSWKDFNILIENVSVEDKIEHIFLVNIGFHMENTNKKFNV